MTIFPARKHISHLSPPPFLFVFVALRSEHVSAPHAENMTFRIRDITQGVVSGM